MGIKGLLQSLRPVEKEINISSYKGKTVAIDGHCILHRGCFGAATNLALKQPTDSYVTHFMHYIGLFEFHGVTPIVVFDGLPLPLKKVTNDERCRLRNNALKEGHALYKQGKHAEAEKSFQQAVTITDDIINAIIRILIAKKVQCIVAPNEADAQLTHLVRTGKADAVVTEDSDLLAFGCKKCIYKIDRYGNGVEISLDQVLNSNASIFRGYDVEKFRHICILSGCDYLPSLKGIGLRTILKQFDSNKNTDHSLNWLKFKLKKNFPSDYIENFYLANLGFLHQWVYDIDEMCYIRSNPLPANCFRQDMLKLGKIPAVQDSTIFRVNKLIPKSKPKNEPLNEAITEEFIAFIDTVKENISPSPESPESKSPKSPVLTKSPILSKSPRSKAHNAEPLGDISSQQARVERSPIASRIVNHIPAAASKMVLKVSTHKDKEQTFCESSQQKVNSMCTVSPMISSVSTVTTNGLTDDNAEKIPTKSSKQKIVRTAAASASNFSTDKELIESSQRTAASPRINPQPTAAETTILADSADKTNEQKLAVWSKSDRLDAFYLRHGVLPRNKSSPNIRPLQRLKASGHCTSSSFTDHLGITNTSDIDSVPTRRGPVTKPNERPKDLEYRQSSSSTSILHWKTPPSRSEFTSFYMDQRQEFISFQKLRSSHKIIETTKKRIFENRTTRENARFAQVQTSADKLYPSASDTRSNPNNIIEPVISTAYTASATPSTSTSTSPSSSSSLSPHSPCEQLPGNEKMQNLLSRRKRSFDDLEDDHNCVSTKHFKYTHQAIIGQGSDLTQISSSSMTSNISSAAKYTRSNINDTSAPNISTPYTALAIPSKSLSQSPHGQFRSNSSLHRKRSFDDSENAQNDYHNNFAEHLRRMR